MKCGCGKKAVIFRRYEGLHLCKNCFCKSIEKRVKRTVRQNNMIKKDDRIAFGLSGGKDSSVVLYIMLQILKPMKADFFAFTIDEGIKGYRDGSIRIAKKLCKKLDVKYHIYSYKEHLGTTLDKKMEEVRKNPDLLQTNCSYCGVARRYLLNKVARDLKATKLCVGHNLDDETQTIIMNYVRGDMAKASRMGAITDYSIPKDGTFVPRIKPLRGIPEKEVTLYALLKGLDVQEDECPYASGIRFDVRDFLNSMEHKYPGIKFSVLESFDKMLPIVRTFVDKQKKKIRHCKKCGEPSSEEICNACKMWS
ncbi:MAG: TIGR00269 family protein [Candidatus Aenigmatarchaeota archaeon]|nr:TIGR00269 family protein [Nanoarchaeota archaeon]